MCTAVCSIYLFSCIKIIHYRIQSISCTVSYIILITNRHAILYFYLVLCFPDKNIKLLHCATSQGLVGLPDCSDQIPCKPGPETAKKNWHAPQHARLPQTCLSKRRNSEEAFFVVTLLSRCANKRQNKLTPPHS